ncbi:MAG TPA: helix-turn-helix transcriptional regulator, partial [Iamia sp.]
EVLLDAGRAVAATAPLVAADHLCRAVELLPAGADRRGEVLAAQARALHLGARPREAAAAGRAALAELPAGTTRAAIAATVANDLYVGGDVDGALDVIAAERERGEARCPLLSMQVNLWLQADHPDRAADGYAAARAELDGPDVTPAAALSALAHLVQYANHVGRVEEAAALLDRVRALTERSSPTVALAAHELTAFADWRPGLLHRIDDHLAAARRLRPDDVTLSIGGSVEAGQVRRDWLAGEWDAALDLVRTASFDLDQRGTTVGAQMLLGGAAEILIDRGDIDQATAIAGRLVTPLMALRRIAVLVRARLHRALDEPAEATAVLQAELDASPPGGSLWRHAEMRRELVELHLDAGRPDAARAEAAAIEELAVRTGWVECQIPALRARALVDQDVEVARAYQDLAEAEGWAVEAAHAALLRGELGDDPATHLTAAYRAFDAFGAARWRRRSAAALRAGGLTVPRRAAQPRSELSDTDAQLVRLVRDGLTNRQIAAAMHYSPKTIEVYLSRIYAKTGCASRLELIRALDRGTLTTDPG